MDEPVTIVGGGIVGICCALSLQERGVPVRIIERDQPGQQTSYGNAGVISPWSIIPQSMPGIWREVPGMLLRRGGPLSVRSSFWPHMIPWGLQFLANGNENKVRQSSKMMEFLCGPSIELYRHHLKGTGRENLLTESYYIHAFQDHESPSFDMLDYSLRRERGADIELIDGAELRHLEPALSPSFKSAIVIKGQARGRSPGKIAHALAKKAKMQGADFVKAELQEIAQKEDNSWLLKTTAGSFSTTKLVVAAGVWSRDLLKMLDLKMPLVAERGYHVEFPNPGVELNNSVMDVKGKVVASSMVDGLRLAGMAEFGEIDAPADPRKHRQLINLAKSMLPDLSSDGSRFWLGRRPSFPDSLPAIGPVDGKPGLITAFGHSHHGLMMAPKTGEVVADMAIGRALNVDLSAINLGRF